MPPRKRRSQAAHIRIESRWRCRGAAPEWAQRGAGTRPAATTRIQFGQHASTGAQFYLGLASGCPKEWPAGSAGDRLSRQRARAWCHSDALHLTWNEPDYGRVRRRCTVIRGEPLLRALIAKKTSDGDQFGPTASFAGDS